MEGGGGCQVGSRGVDRESLRQDEVHPDMESNSNGQCELFVCVNLRFDLISSVTSSGVEKVASSGYTPDTTPSPSPRILRFSTGIAGGYTPTRTVAPASESIRAMAQP